MSNGLTGPGSSNGSLFSKFLLQPAATWGMTSHSKWQDYNGPKPIVWHSRGFCSCRINQRSTCSISPRHMAKARVMDGVRIFFGQPEGTEVALALYLYKPITEWKSGVDTPIYRRQIPELEPSSSAEWRQPCLNVDLYLFDVCKILSIMSPWFHMTVFVVLFG